MSNAPIFQEAASVITGYGAGYVRLGNQHIEAAAITITENNHTTHDTMEDAINALDAESLNDAEIILIGTGEQRAPLPAAHLSPLRDHAISVDVMNTGAACRTYNILRSEGRSIIAIIATL